MSHELAVIEHNDADVIALGLAVGCDGTWCAWVDEAPYILASLETDRVALRPARAAEPWRVTIASSQHAVRTALREPFAGDALVQLYRAEAEPGADVAAVRAAWRARVDVLAALGPHFTGDEGFNVPGVGPVIVWRVRQWLFASCAATRESFAVPLPSTLAVTKGGSA